MITPFTSDAPFLATEAHGKADFDQIAAHLLCQTARSARFLGLVGRVSGNIGRIYQMGQSNDVSGTAVLAISESLLLALNDRNILPESEIIGILKDAAAAHQSRAKRREWLV